MNKIWESYNPQWLVELAEYEMPEEKWLVDSLKKCTKYSIESKAYYHFVDQNSNEWKFEKNILLNHKKEGELVLDILEGGRVGGVEFLSRL